jgi:hypothetical protein
LAIIEEIKTEVEGRKIVGYIKDEKTAYVSQFVFTINDYGRYNDGGKRRMDSVNKAHYTGHLDDELLQMAAKMRALKQQIIELQEENQGLRESNVYKSLKSPKCSRTFSLYTLIFENFGIFLTCELLKRMVGVDGIEPPTSTL